MADNNERNGSITTSQEIKEIFANKILGKPVKESFEELLHSFLRDHRKNDGHPVKEGTRQRYSAVYNHLLEYSRSHKITLDIERIDEDFFKGFREYLSRIKELTDNTVVKILRTLKTFLRHYQKKG